MLSSAGGTSTTTSFNETISGALSLSWIWKASRSESGAGSSSMVTRRQGLVSSMSSGMPSRRGSGSGSGTGSGTGLPSASKRRQGLVSSTSSGMTSRSESGAVSTSSGMASRSESGAGSSSTSEASISSRLSGAFSVPAPAFLSVFTGAHSGPLPLASDFARLSAPSALAASSCGSLSASASVSVGSAGVGVTSSSALADGRFSSGALELFAAGSATLALAPSFGAGGRRDSTSLSHEPKVITFPSGPITVHLPACSVGAGVIATSRMWPHALHRTRGSPPSSGTCTA